MWRQTTLLLLSVFQLLAATTFSQSLKQCSVHIERPEDDKTDLELGEMVLQVSQPGSPNKIVESFPCTPDGNCFALVQDMPSFTLKVKGPQSALFEPKQISVDADSSCEDLTFVLKGYSCVIPVKMRTGDGSLVDGPEGL